jgi:hypothetical protein
MTNQISTSIPIKRLGYPGIPKELVLVPVFPDSKLSDHERLTDKNMRRFQLRALLGKHSSREGDISATITKNDGDSFVLADNAAVVSKLYSPVGEMFLHHNEKRELSLVEFECEAQTVSGAKGKFLEALTPFLDHLSFVANIPLHILRIVCIDLSHHIQSIEYLGPHASVKINPHASSLWEELFPIYALYREAKNNPSSFYKFLCYYKIIEGIYSWLRPELFKQAKSKSIVISKRKELVPKLYEPLPEQAALEGKPIKEVFDSRFRPEFRDQAAHFLLNENQPLNVSDFNINAKFSNELVLIEACVQVVVETHEAYLEEFQKNSL